MSEEAVDSFFKAPALPLTFAKPLPKEEKKEKPVQAPELPPNRASDNKSEEKQETASENGGKSSKPPPEAPPLNYGPPPWACEPPEGLCYKLEILKNGTIVDVIDLETRKNPSFVVIGRLPICDVVMDHPSISRYHCILQYGDDTMDKKGKGWFIFDMGSTHGSKMNKNRLPARQFIRVQVGFVFQFGGSSRIMSLLGPAEDAEPEWDCSPTEMREKVQKKALERKLAAQAKKEFEMEQEREKAEEEGCNWGMDYGEGDGSAPMFELEGHLAEDGEAYYNADPKKALTKFFERVGFDMKFDYSESGQGHTHKWTCTIELPVEIDGVDRSVTAQAVVSTSKKDATVQCALEACKILDRYNVLRTSNSRLRMKKKTMEENDFFDEDDDLYFDRTGQLEAQREKRKVWAMKAAGKMKEEKDTYESLTAKLKATREEMAEIQKELDQLGHKGAVVGGSAADLDDYVNQLAKGTITVKDDMHTKMQKSTLRQKLVALTHEAQTLEKLVKIAKPITLPPLIAPGGASAASASKQAFLRKMMQFGNVKKDLTAAKTGETPQAENKEEEKTEETFKGPSLPPPAHIPTKPVEEASKLAVADEKLEEVPSPSESKKSEPVECSSEASTSITKPVEEPSPVEPVETPVEVVKEEEEKKEDELEPVPEERKRAADTTSDGDTVVQKKRKPRVRKEKERAVEEYGTGCEFKDEQYATWMPPENQSGDGKTALHEKFAGRY